MAAHPEIIEQESRDNDVRERIKKPNPRDLIMTASKVGEESVIRLERVNKRLTNLDSAHYIGQGPFQGIIINKAATALNDVEKPSVSMAFTACLEGSKRPVRENRELRFWFKQTADPNIRRSSANEYFKELLVPEAFPKDYVNFIKKAIVLCQGFPLLKRIELSIKPSQVTEGSETYEFRETREVEEIIAPKKAASTSTARSANSFTTTTTTTTTTSTKKGRGIDEEEEEEEEYTDEQLDSMIKNYITVLTPAVYDYQFLPEVPVSRKRWVTFKVKAKSDAHIALSSVYGDTERKTYEIVIGAGDNSKTQVKDGGQGRVMEEVMTLGILDPYDFRPFWISWAKHTIDVGEGYFRGENRILRCSIPAKKQHSVNCMSVSTAPKSDGEWEFVEYIASTQPGDDEAANKESRRQQIRLSMLWAAKKQKMLQTLEDAYPNSVNTATLLSTAQVRMSAMMQAVVFLKDLQKRKLITEVSKGIWMRAPSNKQDDKHDVRIVDELPQISLEDSPSIAIITAMYCEKLALDAMMDHKVTYVNFKKDSQVTDEANVYTLGQVGSHRVVSVKLPKMGSSKAATIAAENSVTRLMGMFKGIEHIILLGVGGAVPNFNDPDKHLRLGNVLVSVPVRSGGPLYIHCDKAEPKKHGDSYDFTNRSWTSENTTLHRTVEQLKRMQEKGTLSTPPWDRYIEQGLETMQAEESDFHRPPTKTDRLHYLVDGKVVEVHHPQGSTPAALGNTVVKYGPIGASKYVARNITLRQDFAQSTGVAGYDSEFGDVLDAVLGSSGRGKASFILVRGIADYVDGTARRGWAPYAALCAAGYVRSLLAAMPAPPSRRRGGRY